MLVMLSLNRSDMRTIYIALVFAQNEATLFNRNYCIVTYDQPLFYKAVDIVHASAELYDCAIWWLTHVLLIIGLNSYIMSGVGRIRCATLYTQREAYLRC